MYFGSPVAGISSQDTLPLQMLTQRILNSNIAFGSFIVKYRRSHIFRRRNIRRAACQAGEACLFSGIILSAAKDYSATVSAYYGRQPVRVFRSEVLWVDAST